MRIRKLDSDSHRSLLFAAGGAASALCVCVMATALAQGYNPAYNPRHSYGMNNGSGGDYSQGQGWNPNATNYYGSTNSRPITQPVAPPVNVEAPHGNLVAYLKKDFPLPASGDEAEQFRVPMLANLAAGGMHKRQFRMMR